MGVFNSKKTGGWGFIIRDDRGQVVKASAGRQDFLQDPLHVELLGLQAGLKEAANLGIHRLCVEPDATLVK